MPDGVFITFEGGEGSGKTTQIKSLCKWLEEQGREVVLTREPGGTPEAEKIRDLVVQRDGGNWSPEAEVLLLYTARQMHVQDLVKPALEAGKVVISDRFADSTRAYQSYGHGLPLDFVNNIHAFVLGNMEPDLTFLLDIPVKEGLTRSKVHLSSSKDNREQTEDRFEGLDISFHEKLRQGFLELAKASPDRFEIMDARDSIETLQQNIRDIIIKRGVL